MRKLLIDVLWTLAGAMAALGWVFGVASILGGCAESHARPGQYAPPATDAGPAEPLCVRWWADPDFPEDARCVEWAGGDSGSEPEGCRIAPFYGPGDPAGACL